MTKLTVMSNLHTLTGDFPGQGHIESVEYPQRRLGWWERFKQFRRSFKCDYLLLFYQFGTLLLFGLLKVICPFHRCRLVSLDTILNRPRSFGEWLIWPLKVLALKKIHMHLMFFHDTSRLTRVYCIHPKRFRYIPFKINSYEKAVNTKATDEGFIFTGGVSKRDYDTFLDAVRDLPYPVKMIAGSPELMELHGSMPLDTSRIPPHVELFTEFNPGFFSKLMASSRLIVLPIRKDFLGGAGISVYLEAMAYRKCVIVTAGPHVDGLLNNDEAIIVPPGDVTAMREAIRRAYADEGYRCGFGKRGYDYAIGLGGEDRLIESCAEALFEDARSRHRRATSSTSTDY